MTMFLAPYTAIADIDGSPLDAGFLFFGEYNKDPELFPVPVYWDSDFTVPAAQPIRTRNGYPVRNGSPTKVYLKTAQHSIVIKNRNGAFILVDFKNKGWDTSFVVDASGETQQQVNYNGGVKWYSRVGGYQENERVVLENGDIVQSVVDGNTVDPNLDMTGWIKVNSAKHIKDESGLDQQHINLDTVSFSYFSDPSKTISFNLNSGDITAQLQALKTLIQPYTKVKFPYGDFTVSDEVNFTQDGIWLDGENTRITQTGTRKKIFKSTGTKGFRVSGFELIGKGTEHAGTSTSYNGVAAVFLDSCENARIYDNTLKNFSGSSIRWTGYAKGHRIINNDITGIGTAGGIMPEDNSNDFGIGAYASTSDDDILIQGNNITNTCFGIGLSKGKGCRIVSNTIRDIVGQHGMYLSNPSNLIVSGNSVRNTAMEGIKIQIATESLISEKIAVFGNTVDTTGNTGITIGTVSGLTLARFNELSVYGNKVFNAGGNGINITHADDYDVYKNSVKGAGAYGYLITASYGDFNNNKAKNSEWSGGYFELSDDTYFSENDLQDCCLNASDAAGQARYWYYAQFSKSSLAASNPKLLYKNNTLRIKNSAPPEFLGSSGRSFRMGSNVDLYHIGRNINLTGKPMQTTAGLVKMREVGYSPNVDDATTATLNPTSPIYGSGRRELYSTQDPVTAGMTDTFRIGDRVYHAQPTTFIGWVLTASGWKTFGSIT